MDGLEVSIHALLAECDPSPEVAPSEANCFNPRTPCGVRHDQPRLQELLYLFQSTHSLRSATRTRRHSLRNEQFQSTHSLRSATPTKGSPGGFGVWFQSTHSLRSATAAKIFIIFLTAVSIHALLAECDGAYWSIIGDRRGFQSTHSLRSATLDTQRLKHVHVVSIHALLAECDQTVTFLPSLSTSFNPRTPCGVRLP